MASRKAWTKSSFFPSSSMKRDKNFFPFTSGGRERMERAASFAEMMLPFIDTVRMPSDMFLMMLLFINSS